MLRITVVLSICISMVLGQCQSPEPVKFFNRKEFSGSWRIHTIIGEPVLLPAPSCYALEFTGIPRYDVSATYRAEDQMKSMPGVETEGDNGVMSIKMDGKDIYKVILDTDHSTYYTSYQCNKADPTHRSIAVALRSKERNEELIKEQIAKAQKLVNVPESRYDADQNGC